MTKKPLSFLVALAFALVDAAAPLAAQSTPASARAGDEAPVKLGAFEVRAADTDEYRAAHTTAGTRYNAPLADLPMMIDVQTEAFIRDIGATDVRQALEYVSGVQLDTTAGGTGNSRDNPENGTLFIRGLSAGATLKDGFQHFTPMDSITIGRLDVIKGPGGALYGQGTQGGVVQVSSVRPRDRAHTRLSQSLGSYDYSRTEFLWSGPLTADKSVGFALPIAYQRSGSQAMYYETDTLVLNPTLEWKLTPRTKLIFSLESRNYDRDRIGSLTLTDNGRAPDGSFYGINIPGRASTNRIINSPDVKTFRFEGPDTLRSERSMVRTLRVDHAFTDDLQLWAGYNHEIQHHRERSFNLAIRNANDASIPLKIRNDPRFLALLRPAIAGSQPQVMDIRPNNILNDFVTVRPTFKSELYYAFKTGPVSHRFVAGISYGVTKQGNYAPTTNFLYGNTGNPNDPVTQAWEALPADVILSRFRSLTDYTSVKRWDPTIIGQYPTMATSALGTPAARTVAYYYDRNTYGNLQSSFFRGRIQTILGLLLARNDRQTRVYDVDGDFLWAGPPPPGSPSGTPSGIMRPEPVKSRAPSGTIIWLPENRMRVYFNAMAAVDPGPAYSGYDGDGNPLTAAEVANMELGLRLDILRNKLLFTGAVFRSERQNNPVNIAAAIQNLPFARGTGATLTSGFGAFVNTSFKSEGFDAKLDYIVTPELRLNVGVTRNDAYFTALDPFVEPANPNPQFLAAQQRFIAAGGSAQSFVGTRPDDLSKYTGAGYIRYEFRRTFLRGLSAMLGARYYGSRLQQSVSINTTTGDATLTRFQVRPHTQIDLNLAYRLKVSRYQTEYRLNIANLEDDQRYYGAAFWAPRTIRGTVGVNF